MVPNLLFLFFFLLCLIIVKTQVYGTFVGVSIATVWLAKIGLYLLVFADVVITSGSLVIIVCLCVWWLLFRWVIKFLRSRSCFWSDLRKGMIKTLRPKNITSCQLFQRFKETFAFGIQNPGIFSCWIRNPGFGILTQQSESRIPLTIRIGKPSSTDKKSG